MINIINDVFKKTKVNYSKLIKYGFKNNINNYIYEKEFLNDFRAIITVNENNNITGKVIDLQTNDEYTNINMDINGTFVNQIRDEYKKILTDIKNNCFTRIYFISSQANRITNYIINKYHNYPEFLWKKFDGYGVFRNLNNNKWYAIIMNVDFSKIDNKTGEIEIINIKLKEEKIRELLKENGFYKSYHMNKKDWISMVLNDTIKDEIIEELIDESYKLIDSKGDNYEVGC